MVLLPVLGQALRLKHRLPGLLSLMGSESRCHRVLPWDWGHGQHTKPGCVQPGSG